MSLAVHYGLGALASLVIVGVVTVALLWALSLNHDHFDWR